MWASIRWLAFGFFLAAGTCLADCGSIPFKPYASVFEPNQRALIAWNGDEEILLLTTDLRASEPTKVLEVIPFPSEPKVKKGDWAVFSKATDLINRKLSPGDRMAYRRVGRGGVGADGAPPPPAGEVTFHRKIGAHDISVTRVVDQRRFVEWVEEYLKKAGVDNPAIPEVMKASVKEYLADGFGWFVFDVVELGRETFSKEAIQYRFRTDFLYYPLRISRTGQGDTSVRLLILSPRLVRLPEPRGPQIRLVHTPVEVSKGEVKSLDKDLDRLFEKTPQRSLVLRIWEIQGALSSFSEDVITR
jgi:hypothetical protein